MVAKFTGFLLLFLSVISYCAQSQSVEAKLTTADSLFLQKKYTESFELYAQIFDVDKQYTDQMLLKMAFIKEGLGEYDKALFYLYKYYLIGYDINVLDKISKISNDYQLLGYNATDSIYVINLIRKYIDDIIVAISVLIILMIGVVIYKKVFKNQRPAYSGATLITLILLLLVIINFAGMPDEAIVSSERTYLLSGPSSGADLVEIIGKGHKVRVIDQSDVWSKIETEGKTAYTRTNNLILIP